MNKFHIWRYTIQDLINILYLILITQTYFILFYLSYFNYPNENIRPKWNTYRANPNYMCQNPSNISHLHYKKVDTQSITEMSSKPKCVPRYESRSKHNLSRNYVIVQYFTLWVNIFFPPLL